MYTIMIVDDEPLTREYMKKNASLIDSRWQVTAEATNGIEALDILNINLVDLIITDIKMPVMDGLMLCNQVYNKYPNIRIIILSGYEEFDFAKEAMKYGVKDYLLKPLVKNDLKNILNNIAEAIEKNKNTELTYKAMSSLSEESKKLVIKNFLKAVISESNIEIKTIYPILFKLKVSLIEYEGVLLLLKVNEGSLLKNSIQMRELPLFKFILTEISSNIVGKLENITVFLDNNENTVLLINIDDKNNYIEKSKAIFLQISNEFKAKTGLTLSGGIGQPENNVLQLKTSYEKSYYALECSLLYGDTPIYSYEETKITFEKELKNIKDTIRSIQSGLLDNNETQWTLSLTKYVDNINKLTNTVIFKYSIFLIDSLKTTLPYLSEKQLNDAYAELKTFSSFPEVALVKENVLTTMKNMINALISKDNYNTDNLNKNDIVNKAKMYIYTHYSEAISLEIIAEKISVSYSYLSNIFHKNEGESYMKFLTRVRMEEAAKLLRTNPKIKIYDVAEKVGYVSVKHFSYIFKNYFNTTPSEYLEVTNELQKKINKKGTS